MYGICFWKGSDVKRDKKFLRFSGIGLGGGPLCRWRNSDFLISLFDPLGLNIEAWETEPPTITAYLFNTWLSSGLRRKYCPGSTYWSPMALLFNYFSKVSLVPLAGLMITFLTLPTSVLSLPIMINDDTCFFLNFQLLIDTYGACCNECCCLPQSKAGVKRTNRISFYIAS